MSKRNIADNLLWRFAERVLAQLVTFIVSVILARIIDPEAYGTIALITVFTAILQVFVESGLGNALIQKVDADDIDFSSVFYFNIFICIGLYILLYIFAPSIATFFNDASLALYVRVLGLTIVISGIKNVQQAYVSRHLMFRKFFFSTLGGTVVAGIVGVILALYGAGVWALIAQHLVNLSIDTLILWFTVKWRPKRAFSLQRLKKLYKFGWKMLLSSLLQSVYKEVCQLIIGKKYTATDLAYYNQGQKIPNLIVNNINTSIDSVLFPVMSDEQEDREKIKNITKRSIMTSVYIMAPLMIGVAAIADTLVTLLLTNKWQLTVPYLRIFCITYIFFPIHTANLNAIKAMGRSDLFLILEILKSIIGLVAIFITMNISVMAMAYSLLVTSVFNQIINSWPNRKLLNYSYSEQLKDILPSIVIALFMGICVYLIGRLNFPNIIKLLIQIITGGVLYIACSQLLKIESYDYVKRIIISYKTGRKD